uniref:Uncharacterized protein n=1 Tax=Salix viminalis TaxID=40686 RepID=A0A6N2M041_SALVM
MTVTMPGRHNSRKLPRKIQLCRVANTSGRRILARKNGARVNRLALGVDKRVNFLESLGRREPLEGRRGRGGGVKD